MTKAITKSPEPPDWNPWRRIGMVFVSGEFSMSMSRASERSGSEPSQGPPGTSPSSSTSAFQPPDPSWRSSS